MSLLCVPPHLWSLWHLSLYINPLLLSLGSWSLGFMSVCLIVVLTLKYVSIPYLPHIFLKLSDNPLVYGITTYPTLVLIAVLVFAVPAVLLLWSSEALLVEVTSGSKPWSCDAWFPLLFLVVVELVLLIPCWMLLSTLVSPHLFSLLWTLLMVQGAYLPFTRASLRCDNSFWSSSGLAQTVLALCVSVPMTLYLVDKLWWLSHCKYWSIWVGLWYTVNERELSASGVTKVSRKGIPPFPWEPSTVNLIAGSMLLICFRNSCVWILCLMSHVSSTNLYQYLGD